MWLDVLRRVRWGNVGLALAVPTLIVWWVVGPLTGTSPSPRLPPDRTVPLLPVLDAPEVAETPRAPATHRKKKPATEHKQPARKPRPPKRPRARTAIHHRPQPHVTQRAARPAPQPTTPAVVAPTRAPPPPATPRPAVTGEFNFEGG